ncbi:unnamed protein product [Pseudo-nitzschia multistriata]|uniref:BTB domain-containing protein n=1 Tax=Pseudo-nitzschia multistriata TaxID=183589 RepID=A0A448ZPX5_9STRA|nr:unnamed protein product [Pseudo-nitzschia multistriata]
MHRRNSDIVLLNVGGTLFTSSVSTLVSSSSYFESRLSKEWQEQDTISEEPIVIDQDPKVFSILLSYMRLGYINADEITTPVLLLAKFFGIEQLLRAVKAEARRSKFEGQNLEIFYTAQAAFLVTENDVRKEFASVSMYNPYSLSFVNNPVNDDEDILLTVPDFVVSVEVPREDGTVEKVPNCVTFIDALNYLNKLGYTRYEKDMLETTKQLSYIQARLWFSKLILHDVEDMEVDSKEDFFAMNKTIIKSDTREKRKSYPRQFCCVIENYARELDDFERSMLEAQVGTTKTRQIIDHHGDESEEFLISNVEVRSTVQGNIHSKIKQSNWLQRQGYIHSEAEIAKAYGVAIKCLKAHCAPNKIGLDKVSIWSRPLDKSDIT